MVGNNPDSSNTGVAGGDAVEIQGLRETVERLELERQEADSRYREVEAENRDFAARYIEAETENNSLLNMYVASYQLHSTLDFDEVLSIIAEIVLRPRGTPAAFGV